MGPLGVGVTAVTGSPVLNRVVEDFQARYPDCGASVDGGDVWELCDPRRQDEVDLLYDCVAVDYTDLKTLATGIGFKWCANSRSNESPSSYGDATRHFPPPRIPSGTAHSGTHVVRTLQEGAPRVVQNEYVHATMISLLVFARDDIALVPVRDSATTPHGLLWGSADENARQSQNWREGTNH